MKDYKQVHGLKIVLRMFPTEIHSANADEVLSMM